MKRVLFVGQAMPKVKRDPHDWPSLNAWLYSIDITQDQIKNNFLYTALVNYFPGSQNGSHLVPTKEEISKERKRLETTINSFNPDILIPIGKLSISYCFNEKIKPLNQYIGNIFTIRPYGLMNKEILVIPFPHPSGASTWYHKQEHKNLLFKALTNLKSNL